ncbi:uncharacterized protein PAC_16530 [Phialocephala subalpina]|uniref:F-box domain-containing protein n=1 Tax=Phialocephala subalpina TaxID=576137 RepID=A0A1L7XNL8_9HELO|nr:uncharacterized protein PAC_16530 [Phialocephala subalpina]
MEQNPGGMLMAVPPEIRSQIYRLLLVHKEPILIATPRRRSFKELLLSDARGSILYVNKAIHSEAIRIFFEYNTFIVGNGTGADEASLSGLKAFVTYIPAPLIASISHIHFHVYLRMKQQRSSRNNNDPSTTLGLPVQSSLDLDPEETPFNSGEKYSMGSPAEALEIRQLSRRIPKHFTGLNRLTVDWVSSEVQIWPGRILPQAPTITVLSNAITSFMRLPKLHNICVREDECVYVQEVLERIITEGEKIGRIIDLQHLRYIPGVSGRLRDGNRVQREIRLGWCDLKDFDISA